jgi:hypothetical protein
MERNINEVYMNRPVVKRIVRVFFLAFVVGLLALAGEYWNWKSTRSEGETRLAEAINNLDEKEPGWRDYLATRNRRLDPAEKNSAERAFAVVNSLPRDFHDWCNEANPKENLESNQLCTDENIAELREMMQPYAAKIDQLKELVDTSLKSGFEYTLSEPNPSKTLVENRMRFRRAALLIMFDTEIHLGQKNERACIENCRAILGAGRAIGDDPNLISQLVRMAQSTVAVMSCERILGCGHPRIGLPELQSEFYQETKIGHLRNALYGERIHMDQLFERLDQNQLGLEHVGYPNPPSSSFSIDRISWTNYRQYVPAQRAEQLEIYNQLIEYTKYDYPKRMEWTNQISERIDAITDKKKDLIRYLTPAFQIIDKAEQRTKALLLCAVVGIACERFRIDKGRWPNDLEEIPKTILDAVPSDPYTGLPLIMNRTETGLVIYSTGIDGFDDGGETLDQKMEPGTDIGFRLYDLAHRRKPAPKPTPPEIESPDVTP